MTGVQTCALPILIFNTFRDFYQQLATYYYSTPDHQKSARKLWGELAPFVEELNTTEAAELVTGFVADTADFWKDITFEQYQKEVLDEPQKTEKEPKEKKDKKKKGK